MLWVDGETAFDAHDTGGLKYRTRLPSARAVIETWRRVLGTARIIVVRGDDASDDVVTNAIAVAREAGMRVRVAHRADVVDVVDESP